MGRRPQPTEIRRLKGNPSKRPLNESEPKYPDTLLSAPAYLTREGKKEWLRVGNLLCSNRVMTQADFAVFALYCFAVQEWTRIARAFKSGELSDTDTTPNGYRVQSVDMVNMKAYAKQIQATAVELGLTPSSRSKIKAGDPTASDEMTKMLGLD
jgi:P27 family predicted phage terminase small subunit